MPRDSASDEMTAGEPRVHVMTSVSHQRFFLLGTGLVFIAFALREWFVLASVLPFPTQGDVSGYLRYAIHMATQGVFSEAEAGQPVLPDAFRGPGYPLFLLGILKLTGPQNWYWGVYQAQAIIGACNVAIVIALARQWAGPITAMSAGLLLAVWPHNIAATNAMLVEVVFGCCMTLSILLSTLAISRSSSRLGVAAGIALGLSYLVNPVTALFPVALLAVCRTKAKLRLGLLILVIATIPVLAWSVRNNYVGATANTRAWQNLEQGSWPELYFALRFSQADPRALQIRDQIDTETGILLRDHPKGLKMMSRRLAEHPLDTLRWYALQKPYLLWDWSIQAGAGGPYTLDVKNSPLDRGLLASWKSLARLLNPALFVFAVGFALLHFLRSSTIAPSALFFLYITAVHDVFQAEPRYAIAYRPIEIVLAMGGVCALSMAARALLAGRGETFLK